MKIKFWVSSTKFFFRFVKMANKFNVGFTSDWSDSLVALTRELNGVNQLDETQQLSEWNEENVAFNCFNKALFPDLEARAINLMNSWMNAFAIAAAAWRNHSKTNGSTWNEWIYSNGKRKSHWGSIKRLLQNKKRKKGKKKKLIVSSFFLGELPGKSLWSLPSSSTSGGSSK